MLLNPSTLLVAIMICFSFTEVPWDKCVNFMWRSMLSLVPIVMTAKSFLKTQQRFIIMPFIAVFSTCVLLATAIIKTPKVTFLGRLQSQSPTNMCKFVIIFCCNIVQPCSLLKCLHIFCQLSFCFQANSQLRIWCHFIGICVHQLHIVSVIFHRISMLIACSTPLLCVSCLHKLMLAT